MPTAYIQPMFLLIELFAVIQLVRFWVAIQSTGYFSLVISRYYTAFMSDCVAVFLFAVQLVIALHDWFGLPLDALGIASKSTGVVTWLVFGSFLALSCSSRPRQFTQTSATRTIVVLNALNGSVSRIHS